jgi:AcrR family transcriptional regulator
MTSAASPVPTRAAPAARRADARRNYDNLVAAAAKAFEENGVESSLEDVARRAGVGIGTLYRHFPTREALLEAVYRAEVESLCASAEQLVGTGPADDVLAAWLQLFVGYVSRKRGMASALKSAMRPDSELFAYVHEQIGRAGGSLLTAAVEAGAIRSDVELWDILRMASGICLATEQRPADPEQASRLVGLVVDGLRYRG